MQREQGAERQMVAIVAQLNDISEGAGRALGSGQRRCGIRFLVLALPPCQAHLLTGRLLVLADLRARQDSGRSNASSVS